MNTLQSAVPILWPWKSEPLRVRSRCSPRPYFHASTKAGLRIARPGLWTLLEIRTALRRKPPVLQHSHILGVWIWKSGTSLARSRHAVSPRIPTSPQQTTTAAIYTYLFMFFVVVVAIREAAPAARGTRFAPLGRSPRVLWRSDRNGHPVQLGSLRSRLWICGDRSPFFPRNYPPFHGITAARMVLFGFLHFCHASGVECGQSSHVPQPIPGSRTCPP